MHNCRKRNANVKKINMKECVKIRSNKNERIETRISIDSS